VWIEAGISVSDWGRSFVWVLWVEWFYHQFARFVVLVFRLFIFLVECIGFRGCFENCFCGVDDGLEWHWFCG